MMHPCKLFVDGVAKVETFRSPAQLAARIHELRMGEQIVTRPGAVTTHDFSGACVLVTFKDDPVFMGYAVIGDPELDAEMQDRLLHGQLWNAQPDTRVA